RGERDDRGGARRRRELEGVWKRLRELATMDVPREEMLMKLGAARARAPTAWRLADVEVDNAGARFSYALNRQKLRRIRRREGPAAHQPHRERSRVAVAVLY